MNKLMKKTIKSSLPLFGAALFLAAGLVSCGTKTEAPTRFSSFDELPDPMRDQAPAWTTTKTGLQHSFISTDVRAEKSIEPQIEPIYHTDIVGWQGETLSAQILLWANESVEQVTYHIGDFKSSGATLPASIAEARFVRYVMTDEFAGGCGYRKPEDFKAALAADMLDPIDCMDIEPATVRPLWLTVKIPADAKPGTYKSTIEIAAIDQPKQKFTLAVEVQGHQLPTASEWDFHLDLWQHPAAVARTQNLEMWSDAHFAALKENMKPLAEAGQKVITATLNKDPWNNQCFDPYADMITWTKNQDGTWTYDYTHFDRWVQLMLDLGVNRMINCYSVVPWNNELHYVDGETQEYVTIQANPGTPIFDEVWTAFLADFKKHLTEKGWLEITNIAMDERSPDEMEKTLAMLQREAPELGISFADNQKSYKKFSFLKDISLAAGAPYELADIEERRDRDQITTYYVCCSDAFPNVFTFSEPAEAVYIAWHALAGGFDGFLRWAYNSWVENPLTDSRFRTWPAGDTYIVYPEARSSIRFERLVEGIQDIEKLKLIVTQLDQSDLADKAELKAQLLSTLEGFNTIKPERPYMEMILEAKALLHDISRQLE